MASALPYPPLEGRAIAYGNSRVVSDAWQARPERAWESDREQIGIGSRMATTSARPALGTTIDSTGVSFICDSPALQGRVKT
jgi:hypothetical protein